MTKIHNSPSSKVVTVFRERQSRDRATMRGEVSCTLLLLEIPDLHQGIRCAGTKDETIRMELTTGEAMGDTLVSNLAQQFSCGREGILIWFYDVTIDQSTNLNLTTSI